MAAMTPDTVHLVAQLIRHNRGIATAFEKWVSSQAQETGCRQALREIREYRAALNRIEDRLSRVEVVGSVQDEAPAYRQ